MPNYAIILAKEGTRKIRSAQGSSQGCRDLNVGACLP